MHHLCRSTCEHSARGDQKPSYIDGTRQTAIMSGLITLLHRSRLRMMLSICWVAPPKCTFDGSGYVVHINPSSARIPCAEVSFDSILEHVVTGC
jgi:hypothetical protein